LGFACSATARAAAGDLDPTFSGDGKQLTSFGGSATAVAVQPDGKILVAGSSGYRFALARFNPNGSLDKTFSRDGLQATDFAGAVGVASDVALLPNGKIVAVGTATRGAGNFALARYNHNGSLDTSFSGDGKQTTDFGGDPEFGPEGATSVAIRRDGKIIAVGSSDGYFALARYNSNGSLDANFAGDGKQTDVGGRAEGVAIQPDGKIVAVGFTDTAFALARYNPSGFLDTSFSGDGKQTTEFDNSTRAAAEDVALQPNGKIVAAGGGGATGDFALARYNPNGSLDTSFSGDGRQTTNFGGYNGAYGIAIQDDHKIVLAGFTRDDFGLARYNSKGLLDTSFSGDGKQTTDFGGDAEGAGGVALQANGKIVVAGGTGSQTGPPHDVWALARYNAG
jgi:uncharacterized delta-60 repeat protein